MGAAIVQHMNLIIRVAHLYNRLTANLRGKVIAFIGCLALVSNEYPGVGKQVFHFQLIHGLTGIDVSMYLMTVKQTVNVC